MGILAAVVAAALIALPSLGGPRVNIAAEMSVPAVVALLVLLPLTKRAGRPPVSLLWLPCPLRHRMRTAPPTVG